LKQTLLAYLYLLPAAIILAVFHFLPVLYALYISLHRWKIRKIAFVQFSNYSLALHDPRFWGSLKVTLFYVIGTVPLTLAISLFLAYLLFHKVRGLSFYRTSYFLPYITSTVAAATVWLWIFNPRHGPLNQILALVGIAPQRWMNEPRGIVQMLASALGLHVPAWAAGPSLALVAVIVVTIWHYLGFDVVIFLAGLGNIPTELYDAARIDGAGRWQLFRYITFPLLSPTTFFLLIISTIGAFQSFNIIYVMTAGSGAQLGGPLHTTTTTTIYLFDQFYNQINLGYASAIAFVLFAIILSLTVIQNKMFGERVHYG
jgi:multiple sugar transport system permease protein